MVVTAYNPRVDTVTDLATNKINGYFSNGTPGVLSCVPTACQTGANFLVANQARTVTCAAPANNNGGNGVTTLLNSGFFEFARYLVRLRSFMLCA